jgi:hypothetical protein
MFDTQPHTFLSRHSLGDGGCPLPFHFCLFTFALIITQVVLEITNVVHKKAKKMNEKAILKPKSERK